jgi:hypothetical protein
VRADTLNQPLGNRVKQAPEEKRIFRDQKSLGHQKLLEKTELMSLQSLDHRRREDFGNRLPWNKVENREQLALQDPKVTPRLDSLLCEVPKKRIKQIYNEVKARRAVIKEK